MLRSKLGIGALVVIGAIGLVQPQYALGDAWLRLSGGLKPNGYTMHTFYGRGLRTLAVQGDRWVSPGVSMQSVAFAAVIHFPGDSVVSMGSSHDVSEFTRRVQERWNVIRQLPDAGTVGDPVQFDATYNAITNTVLIDGTVYSLKRGNVFDVHVLNGGRLGVRQLPTRWTGRNTQGPVFDALEQGPTPRRPCPRTAASPAPPVGHET